jgi:hypothetical protein
MSDIRQTHEPSDRLTRLCKTMTDALEADPEYGDDVKCIVFLDDTKRGGLQLHGYEDDAEAITNLFMHLRAMFRSRGQDLLFMPIGEG